MVLLQLFTVGVTRLSLYFVGIFLQGYSNLLFKESMKEAQNEGVPKIRGLYF